MVRHSSGPSRRARLRRKSARRAGARPRAGTHARLRCGPKRTSRSEHVAGKGTSNSATEQKSATPASAHGDAAAAAAAKLLHPAAAGTGSPVRRWRAAGGSGAGVRATLPVRRSACVAHASPMHSNGAAAPRAAVAARHMAVWQRVGARGESWRWWRAAENSFDAFVRHAAAHRGRHAAAALPTGSRRCERLRPRARAARLQPAAHL